MKLSPSKQTHIYLRAILDLLHSENRADRLKNFERRMDVHEGRLERLEIKKKKHEKKSFEKKK